MAYTARKVSTFLLLSLLHNSVKPELDHSNTTRDHIPSVLGENEVEIITLTDNKFAPFTLNVTTYCTFVIFQAHSQYRNVTLSTQYNKEVYTSSNTAILKLISYEQNEFLQAKYYNFIVQPSEGSDYKTLITGVTYSGQAPIPGGCCLTCTLEVDPNLVIKSQQYYKTTMTFSLANVYDYTTADCSGKEGVKPEHYRLQYTVYQYFLEEGNLDNDELFQGLTKMLTPSAVKKHGEKVQMWNPEKDVPSITFDTTRGQGIVFNILVHDPLTNQDAVYSPVVTYGCSFTAKVDGCDSLGSIVNIVLAVAGAFLGLLVCLFGHRLYHLYILLSSSILFSFPGFILLTNGTDWSHTVRMASGVCFGITAGLLVYFFWRLTKFRRIVLLICGLPFGFLVAAIVFFSPFGGLSYWDNEVNYWTVFFCMSVTTPFILLLCLKPFVILVAAFVGGYGFIVGIDTFIRSSLSYIILTVVVRGTEDDFIKYDIPFQKKDYILCCVWFVVTVLGISVQTGISRGQTTLEPMPQRDKQTTRVVPSNRQREAERTARNDNHAPINSKINPDPCFYDEDEDEEFPILVPSRRSATNIENTKYGTNIIC